MAHNLPHQNDEGAVQRNTPIYLRFGSCMDGARGAREKNLTFSRNDTGAVMYPASKSAAVLAAGPDVIR